MGYAALVIDLKQLPKDAHPLRKVGHWEGDWWVEPEQRFNLTSIREKFPMPAGWTLLPEDALPGGVWMEPLSRSLCILVESDAFPETPVHMQMPSIWPKYLHHYDAATQQSYRTFEGYDLGEVERYAGELA